MQSGVNRDPLRTAPASAVRVSYATNFWPFREALDIGAGNERASQLVNGIEVKRLPATQLR